MRGTEACVSKVLFFRARRRRRRRTPDATTRRRRKIIISLLFSYGVVRELVVFLFSFSRRNPALTMRCYSRRSLKTRNRFNSKPNRGLLRRLGRRFEHLTMASDHHGTAGYVIRRRFLHGDDDVPARLPKQTTRREV